MLELHTCLTAATPRFSFEQLVSCNVLRRLMSLEMLSSFSEQSKIGQLLPEEFRFFSKLLVFFFIIIIIRDDLSDAMCNVAVLQVLPLVSFHDCTLNRMTDL